MCEPSLWSMRQSDRSSEKTQKGAESERWNANGPGTERQQEREAEKRNKGSDQGKQTEWCTKASAGWEATHTRGARRPPSGIE